MKMIRCDGCDKVEDFVDRKIPEGFTEVSVSVSTGLNSDGVHLRYDLCNSCQDRLRESIRVAQWPRPAKYQPGMFYDIDEAGLPVMSARP